VDNSREKSFVLGVRIALASAVLCGGGLFAAAKWSELSCERSVEHARKTVRTDTKPIRAELAPLGKATEVHWVVDPHRHCDILPVPGTDRDRQHGVVKLASTEAGDLLGRYTGWETVDPSSTFAELGRLSPYIASGGTWQHTDRLDAQFTGEHSAENASYYVNVDKSVVLFSSYADHGA